MRTWKDIKKIDKSSFYSFQSIEDLKINKFKDCGFDIGYDPDNSVYGLCVHGVPLSNTWKTIGSVYRVISRISVNYVGFMNGEYIEDFLKCNDFYF